MLHNIPALTLAEGAQKFCAPSAVFCMNGIDFIGLLYYNIFN